MAGYPSEASADQQLPDPSDLAEVGKCPEFDAADTEAAVESAQAAFKTFRKTPARAKAAYLRKWFGLMMENMDDLARIITLENGKPFADAKTEVAYAAGFLEWFSEEAPRIYGDTSTFKHRPRTSWPRWKR